MDCSRPDNSDLWILLWSSFARYAVHRDRSIAASYAQQGWLSGMEVQVKDSIREGEKLFLNSVNCLVIRALYIYIYSRRLTLIIQFMVRCIQMPQLQAACFCLADRALVVFVFMEKVSSYYEVVWVVWTEF